MPEPIQLPLFPDQAALTRIEPACNARRFYRMAVWPDLFGRVLLVCRWDRIGAPGRVRLDPYPNLALRSMRSPGSPAQRPPRLPGRPGSLRRQGVTGRRPSQHGRVSVRRRQCRPARRGSGGHPGSSPPPPPVSGSIGEHDLLWGAQDGRARRRLRQGPFLPPLLPTRSPLRPGTPQKFMLS